jgi:hypothetical protein
MLGLKLLSYRNDEREIKRLIQSRSSWELLSLDKEEKFSWH